MKKRILIVEDEAHLADGLRINLELEGYEPIVAANAEEGLRHWERNAADLILLDVMLPGMDGFEFCRLLRERGERVPILFLTAKDRDEDRIRGLEEGGDDYLNKPFNLRELMARIKGMFRREEWQHSRPPVDELHFGEIGVNLRSYELSGPEGVMRLKEKEAMILRLLAERAGDAVDRETIIDRVWGYDAYPSTRTVDNFILGLRKLIEPDSGTPRYLLTVHGKGYRLVLPDQVST
jgi:two-component system, OmpR family, alkaline phosphatase synthesis response regulator PhoP